MYDRSPYIYFLEDVPCTIFKDIREIISGCCTGVVRSPYDYDFHGRLVDISRKMPYKGKLFQLSPHLHRLFRPLPKSMCKKCHESCTQYHYQIILR
ncbi:hypothetical protein MHBO_003417 [Bonamia ostreae]|uniref:Uncharacterized protein n=1 Tax=Bonamia ostreae TaxID=126728 RepID=A0ABV2AQE4_9EUKA